jgi:hypothetical protein
MIIMLVCSLHVRAAMKIIGSSGHSQIDVFSGNIDVVSEILVFLLLKSHTVCKVFSVDA